MFPPNISVFELYGDEVWRTSVLLCNDAARRTGDPHRKSAWIMHIP
jgi:hypothetical protein